MATSSMTSMTSMMSMIDRARAFLELRRFAVVGLSRTPTDFSRAVVRELWKRGFDAVPVHPAAGAGGELGEIGEIGEIREIGEIEGHACYARIADIEPKVEGALLFTPPTVTGEVVREAIAAGVRMVWMHRGVGRGASSPEALAACADAGVVAIDGLCPFMVLPEAAWPHRLHGFFRIRALERHARLLARAARAQTPHAA
jgi:predicted CoA-binding protein